MIESVEQIDMQMEAALADMNLWPIISILVVVALMNLALKAWGMWRAARMGKKWWFIAILILNTAGILPIVFLLLTKEEYKSA